MSFEVAVGTQRFPNVTSATVLGVQLDGLEIVNVLYKRYQVCCDRRDMTNNVPALKSMYRTVAVLRCTLNGCPLKIMRLVTTRVVSVLRKLPVATNSGALSKQNLISLNSTGSYRCRYLVRHLFL